MGSCKYGDRRLRDEADNAALSLPVDGGDRLRARFDSIQFDSREMIVVALVLRLLWKWGRGIYEGGKSFQESPVAADPTAGSDPSDAP